MKPIGYKWVFMRKWNEVMRYKARLVAQDISQKSSVNYDEAYSPVVDTITLRYIMSLVVHEKIDMHLMDIVTTYLYRNLDNNIYMKISKEFNMPEAYNSNPNGNYFIKLQKSFMA
jgi:hypothetical protein